MRRNYPAPTSGRILSEEERSREQSEQIRWLAAGKNKQQCRRRVEGGVGSERGCVLVCCWSPYFWCADCVGWMDSGRLVSTSALRRVVHTYSGDREASGGTAADYSPLEGEVTVRNPWHHGASSCSVLTGLEGDKMMADSSPPVEFECARWWADAICT